jgi:hypothetical protein
MSEKGKTKSDRPHAGGQKLTAKPGGRKGGKGGFWDVLG